MDTLYRMYVGDHLVMPINGPLIWVAGFQGRRRVLSLGLVLSSWGGGGGGGEVGAGGRESQRARGLCSTSSTVIPQGPRRSWAALRSRDCPALCSNYFRLLLPSSNLRSLPLTSSPHPLSQWPHLPLHKA